MYSILIVDDERMIRNGLRDLIPWGELGVGTVRTAASAREAFGVLAGEKVDLLLTDICMPETTGIEMVRQLEGRDPPLRTIVLTGYNDFEYAQQCCRMEVHDFLLKPICEGELMQAVRRQIEELERYQKEKARNRASEVSDAIRLERALRGLAHQERTVEDTAGILAQYGYDPHRPVRAALVIPHLLEGQDWLEENELRMLSIKNVCLEMVDAPHLGITFEDLDGKLGIVFFEGDDVGDTYSLLEQISGRVRDELGAVPKVIMGSTVNGLHELHISYNDAAHLEKETSAAPGGRVYQTKRVEKRMQAFFTAFENSKMQLCANLADEELLLCALEQMRLLFEHTNLSLNFLRRCCFEMAGSAYLTFLLENGGEADERLTTTLELIRTGERDSVLALTREFLLRLFPKDEPATNQLVQKAKQYINDHLADDLSVSSVAAHLYVNSNYFSRLFKQAAAEGCNEYITRKRMEKAKKLLESSSLKTGQVAEKVGYRDKNYFSLAFKKHTGLAPTAYRARVRGGEQGA